jgi:hypothetical protein
MKKINFSDDFMESKLKFFFCDLSSIRQKIALICKYNYDLLEKLNLINEVFRSFQRELEVDVMQVGADEVIPILNFFLVESEVLNQTINFDYIIDFVPFKFSQNHLMNSNI